MNRFFAICCVLLTFVFISCKKSVQTPTTTIVQKSNMTVAVKHKTYNKLDALSENKITDWKEYKIVDELIEGYKHTSPQEALINSSDLQQNILFLKDSLNIQSLKTPAFRSRLNVLENEVLRLSDMAEIPTITSIEVNAQIDKILLVYGSLNDKINTVYDQEQFNAEINLDDFFVLEEKKSTDTKKTEKKNIKKRKRRNLNNRD